MQEGAIALAKLRTYTYILFLIYVLTFFYRNIAALFGTTDRKILYGLVLLACMQITISILYIIKFATTVQENKTKSTIIMYASRVRLTLLLQFVLMAILVLNEIFVQEILIERATLVLCIFMQILLLQSLTILQRRRY